MDRTPAQDPDVFNNPERVAEFERVVASPEFRYTRARSWRADGYIQDNRDYTVYAYVHDAKSPTGVHLGATLAGLDQAAAILDRLGKPFPLSPVERR